MVKKLLRIISKYLLKKAGFPQELLPALMVADPVSAAIGAGGSILGGVLGSKGQSKAAKTAASAQDRAAELQRESAREALGLSREGFEYGQEQDLYQKALQRQLAQQQAAQLQNVQPFINLGLGSLGGLSQMVNPTMQIDPGLYELAGMQPQQATDIGPTFDPSAAREAPPAIDFDEMDRYIAEQLEARRQAQAEEEARQAALEARQAALEAAQKQPVAPTSPAPVPTAQARVGGLGAGQSFQRRRYMNVPKTLAFYTREEMSRMK